MFAPVNSPEPTTPAPTGGPSVAPAALTPPPSTGRAIDAGLRQAVPHDSRFLTVEPDGRDDISFMDRLRHALRTAIEAVQKPEAAAEATDRALQATAEALARGRDSDGVAVQIRIVGVDVAFAEQGSGDSAYASYRRLGIEIGVARGGVVRAEDTTVVGFDGRSFGLSVAQTRTGLSSGQYQLVDAGPAPSGAARERLEAAQSGLARVKAMQDALKAYRGGDIEPLRQLLDGTDAPGGASDRGGSPGGGRFAAVFPGTGALTLN